MAEDKVNKGGRSVDARAGCFAVLLLNTIVAIILLVESWTAPAIVLTTHDGKRIRLNNLRSSVTLGLDNESNGFDIRTDNGIVRINFNFKGVRRLEVLSIAVKKQHFIELGNRHLKLGEDEFEIKVKVEFASGNVIQGVSDVRSWPYKTPREFPTSLIGLAENGEIQLDIHDIKVMEKESTVFYEWSKRLF
jgi:hypothetical protein